MQAFQDCLLVSEVSDWVNLLERSNAAIGMHGIAYLSRKPAEKRRRSPGVITAAPATPEDRFSGLSIRQFDTC